MKIYYLKLLKKLKRRYTLTYYDRVYIEAFILSRPYLYVFTNYNSIPKAYTLHLFHDSQHILSPILDILIKKLII